MLSFFFLAFLLTACTPAPEIEVSYDPADLQFSGERAFELESEFVTRFVNRDSGQPNNRLAVEWLINRFEDLGLSCRTDQWRIVNYSRPIRLQNAICELAGHSDRQIVIVAHHDQAPATVQGADNDGSGIAIMLHLAEIFASGETPRHSLVFLSSDAEEYGMLGSRRFIQTHPDPGHIVAGISLDNLGKEFYDGIEMSPIGQGRRYGPIWLQLLARQGASAAGDLWVPQIRPAFLQALEQAVPVSLMDQGPLVAAGVPALGFAGTYPPESSQQNWETYHTPDDTLEIQSPVSLHHSGRVAEALLRELLSMGSFPSESGPYLYFDSSATVLRGAPMWLTFSSVVVLFVVGSYASARASQGGPSRAWRTALPHFLGLWIPLTLSILLLYAFVLVGLMDAYELYPATAKDPAIFTPRWPAVILYLIALAGLLFLGRKSAERFSTPGKNPDFASRLSLAALVVSLAGLYLLALNPFSLLFLLPLFLWFLIRGRDGVGWWLDLFIFLLSGVVIYALIYFFGFVILRNGFAVLWYLMMMFSIREIGFLTALVATAVVAAGVSLMIRPAR